jgi:hypothetical protein
MSFYSNYREDEFPIAKYLEHISTNGLLCPISISGTVKFNDETLEILQENGFVIIWKKTYYKSDLVPGSEYALMKKIDSKRTIVSIVSMFGSDPWEDPDSDDHIDPFTRSFEEINKEEEEEDDERKVDNVRFFTSTHECSNDVEAIIKMIALPGKKKKAGHIHLIVQQRNSLDTQPFKLLCPELDIEMNYGTKFADSYETIFKSLNDYKNDERGRLLLLHGEPGTGKTTFINYLANKINRKILWLPTMLAESITSPGFISLLMENKGCVLIIEDAERVIGDRNSGSSSSIGVSNILNLTDGVLGDALQIHVIATFNTAKENIDKALLRSGRLIAEHKFEALAVEDANRLLSYLGKEGTTNKPLTLSDIYTFGQKEIKTEEKKSGMGFNR